MTAVVFYTSEASKVFRPDLPRLRVPSFALCWFAAQRKLTIDSNDTVSIYCGEDAPSFTHLSGPVILVDEAVELTQELLDKLTAQKQASILLDTAQESLNWLEEQPLICCGLSFPNPPVGMDTSSYQAFRAWLGQTARSLFNAAGQPSICPVRTARSLPAILIPVRTPNPQAISLNSNAPLVSVIVPSFDRPQFLKRCLESLEQQTLQDFEVLVISNKALECSDCRFKSVIVDGKPAVSEARNLGLAQARGTFVAYLDDDDYFLSNHLELLISSLNESGDPLAFSICARQWETDCQSAALAYDMPFLSGTNWVELLIGNKIPTPAVVHLNKPEFRFDEEFECLEDWDLWLRISKGSNINFVPKVTCLSSRRPEQSSISSSRKLLFHWYAYPVWAKHLNSSAPPEIQKHFRSLLSAHSLQILEKFRNSPPAAHGALIPENRAYVSRAIYQLQQTGYLPLDLSRQLQKILDQNSSITIGQNYTASVVIPLYNGLEFTRALWKSISETPCSLAPQYIFVDNCSTDGTREWFDSLGDKVTTILNDQNRNFAGASNQGAYAANSEIVIFLNNDTEVTPGWAEALIAALLENDTIGAVGNKQVFPGTRRIHHAGIYIDLSGHPKHYLEGILQNDPRVNFVRECSAVTGGCFAMRKQDFVALGGFYEQYKNGYEDIDLLVALKKSGKKIIYTPQSTIYHHVSKSAGRSAHSENNWRLFIERCGSDMVPDLNRFLEQNRRNHC